MKFCTKCGTQCEDDAKVCSNCGNAFGIDMTAYTEVTDHTAEYDPKDISDNKVIAMLPYVLGVLGLIVAILLANTSDYVKFHVRTAIKYLVVEAILTIVTAVLCWTIIVPIAAGICLLIIFVLQIITFIQVCKGEAKDPAIISKLGFLK